MDSVISSYSGDAKSFSERYNRLDPDKVHQVWEGYLPQGGSALDIGAGSGRDANWLASKGFDVTAVEPVEDFIQLGEIEYPNTKIRWVKDAIPELSKVFALHARYDLILVNAVWSHIPPGKRQRCLRKLANYLKPNGRIVFTLRHSSAGSKQYCVCADELKKLAGKQGLHCILEPKTASDLLGRDGISWQTLAFELSDDGTGAFPTLRHIIVNDAKASTYKLALLRVLLRIADGHPGAVARNEENHVIIPLGLVALYWCHQFKPLIDTHQIRQNSDPKKGMGFVKENGWQQLNHRVAEDFAIGNIFAGEEAKALNRTISVAAQTIRDMPCKYISLPNTDEQLFQAEYQSVRASDFLFLDIKTLQGWGNFILPESIWLAFSRYACWIEPVLINEWVNVMQGYQGNEQYSRQFLYDALNWSEPTRTTTEVRKRFEQLQQNNQPQHCVWTDKRLKDKYDIDHCMPFARWPNNDLWNLLPSSSKANNDKRDKLPAETTLQNARPLIHEWWKDAWVNNQIQKSGISQQQRFFAEANLALPGLSADNQSLDDVFEALMAQRGRLKEMQQLREW